MNAPLHPTSDAKRAVTLFGVAFDPVRLNALADEIAAKPAPGQGARTVVTANLDHVVQLRENAALRAAYARSWRRTIDGTPVWLYARMRGVHIPERVTGADLLPAVLTRLRPGAHRIFFVVAEQGIGERLVARMTELGFDSGTVVFEVPPFGFERDPAYGEVLSERIRAHGTTHLIFGVGCPRSETWIDQHRDALGDVYAMSVGAALGFFVGADRRAPKIMQTIGMEWLWRVAQEPQRLGPRYFLRSWAFFAAVAGDLKNREAKP